MTLRERICRNAALWFAEVQDIPPNYKTLQDKYPKGKPDAMPLAVVKISGKIL